MRDEEKTKRQLISELNKLRQFIGEHFNIPKNSIDADDFHSLREASQHTKISQEKFMKSFLQNSIPMGLTTQKEGRFVEVSDAFLKLMGFKRDEVIGNTSTELGLLTEEQRTVVFNEFNKKGKVDNLELQVRPKNGNLISGLFNIVFMSIGKEKYFLTVMTDITERKQLEDELKRSETKFRTLFNSTSDAVMLLDEKNFLDCNKATLAIFGCATREEFCKKHPAELSPSQQPCGTDSIVLANRMIAEAMGKGSIHFEWMHKRNDTGETFPADVLLTAMELNGKQVVQAVVRDITERKQAEEKSQNMLILLQILINTIPSPIFRKDINGRYLGCNKEFENYTGLRRADIIGKSVYDIYPKDVADKYHEKDLALFREPGRQIYEYPIMYADGERHDVVVNKATYFNADGTLGGLVGVMVDITERKQLEFQREAAIKELRESEAKFRRLFNSGKDYVAVHLMGKDGQPMNFIQVNDAACEKLGYTREEMLNLSPRDIDTADSAGQMPELIDKLLENKQVLFETEMICKNGHRIPMEVSVNLFQLNDNQATMCVARDITERKQVEQELANRLIFQQTLIDTIPHPIFFKNEVGRFVGCNRAYEREFGTTRDYMIGKTVLDL